MADELVGGTVHALVALVKAILRFLLELLLHFIVEVVGEILVRIFAPIFRAIGFAIRYLLSPIEWLYRGWFERVRRFVTWRPLAHLAAIAILAVCGFGIGFGASLSYHAMQGDRTTVALER